MAREHGRPFEYLSVKMLKEDAASKIAERDGIEEGLACVFSALESCRTFSLRFTTGQPFVQTAKRKCLHLYDDFMDRDLGLFLGQRGSITAQSSAHGTLAPWSQ
jgi:hypothetical protein